MSYDEQVGRWALAKWIGDADGVRFHESEYGCKVTATNVRFGIASSGACHTCYHEYPALIMDIDCTCPKQVPGVKNPAKMRANPNRFKLNAVDVQIYDDTFSLADAYAEIAAFGD